MYITTSLHDNVPLGENAHSIGELRVSVAQATGECEYTRASSLRRRGGEGQTAQKGALR